VALLSDIGVNQKIAIYGYGEYGKILEYLIFINRMHTLVAIIDDAKKNTKSLFCKVDIASLDELLLDSDTLILVGVVDDYAVSNITNKLKNARCNFALIDNLKEFHTLIHLFTIFDLENNKSKIDLCKKLFETENDKKLYEYLIYFRILEGFTPRQQDGSYMHAWEKQYQEYINPSYIEVCIDGGLFDGHTTSLMLKDMFLNSKNLTIYGFEPLEEVFENGTFKEEIYKSCLMTPVYKALWDKKTTLNFAYHGTCSKVSQNRDSIEIQAISIDEFVIENDIKKIDYIKLDIEGAEIEAINGAIKTIQKDRPQLAISIYHKKEHLYEIPLLINSICKDYNYRLGRYSGNIAETILYAIPKEIEIIEC
jgi:FkbM family methyltransferase